MSKMSYQVRCTRKEAKKTGIISIKIYFMKTAVKHFKDYTMASEVVNNYITKRYERWLDYAKYHCSLAGMSDEAVDVLNEVLCMLLNKDTKYLESLIEVRKNGYTDLDFYILQMIKINITSPTSPYQHKYRQVSVDTEANLSRLDVADVAECDNDKDPDEILDRMHKVRNIFESLNLSKQAKMIFTFRFFADEPFSEWPGQESKKDLYGIYNSVIELIKEKLNGECLF